ncbi:MAG: hypothetical protein GWQ05_23495 [Verrucomicrobiaceae bacterium]|nr:hypothetical protein [Verrucomicrobiaceae bacterium]
MAQLLRQFEKEDKLAEDLKTYVKELQNQEDHLGYRFLRKTDLTRGSEAIIIQFPGMIDIAKDNREYACQSDSIEGWIKDTDFPEMIVTISSTHSKILRRHVPVVMSVTFGRTRQHYARHFALLFDSIGHPTLEDFNSEFPGNISDFSDQLRKGFEIALREKYKVPETDPPIDVVGLHQFCHVHFKSSASRVAKSFFLVPKAKNKMFWAYINRLLSKATIVLHYHETIASIKRNFPDLDDWISWYDNEKRRKHIFPAMGGSTCRGHGENDNGQEGTGGWIKRSFKGKPYLVPCLNHIFLEGLRVENDLLEERAGNRSRHGTKTNPKEREEKNKKRRKARKEKMKQGYTNDGRPPDTEKQLVHDKAKKKGRKKIGRPRGAKGNAPSATNAIDEYHAIPWQYTYEGDTVLNTCPLDSFQQLLAIMRR